MYTDSRFLWDFLDWWWNKKKSCRLPPELIDFLFPSSDFVEKFQNCVTFLKDMIMNEEGKGKWHFPSKTSQFWKYRSFPYETLCLRCLFFVFSSTRFDLKLNCPAKWNELGLIEVFEMIFSRFFTNWMLPFRSNEISSILNCSQVLVF
jgi:hypothetical protein